MTRAVLPSAVLLALLPACGAEPDRDDIWVTACPLASLRLLAFDSESACTSEDPRTRMGSLEPLATTGWVPPAGTDPIQLRVPAGPLAVVAQCADEGDTVRLWGCDDERDGRIEVLLEETCTCGRPSESCSPPAQVWQGGGGAICVPPCPECPGALPDLAGHWPLDEQDGSIAADRSSNANDGTLIGGPIWSTGHVDGGLRFDGVDDHVRVEDGEGLNPPELTIAFWVRPARVEGATQTLVQKLQEEDTDGWLLALAGELPPHVAWSVCASGSCDDAISTTEVRADQWLHVAAVLSGSTSTLYLNGLPEASVTAPMGATTDPMFFGAEDGMLYPLEGLLDDVRLYSQALTDEQIAALAANE